MNKYKTNKLSIDVGFKVNTADVLKSVQDTNRTLLGLPDNLFKAIDYKTTSAMIGAIFCQNIAEQTNSIVNPIEKGHPYVIPRAGMDCDEKTLKAYPQGLEIKCTIGNITQCANLRAGAERVSSLTGLTWQAHHREVRELLALVWDFVEVGSEETFNYPIITGAFYSSELKEEDWGAISGTTGRNTKVSAMVASGKHKLGDGWVLLLDKNNYLLRYKSLLKIV